MVEIPLKTIFRADCAVKEQAEEKLYNLPHKGAKDADCEDDDDVIA